MKRRAKLSLVPEENTHEKKAPDLGANASRGAWSASPASGNIFDVPDSEESAEKSIGPLRRQPTDLQAKRLAKLLLVVAVGALSLYLLKRRFI